MKRFLLFAGETYYALGGMNDFQGCADTIAEAKLYFDNHGNGGFRDWDWFQIVDSETLAVVLQSESQAYGNGD